jgi:hypothetical protein
MQNIFEKKIHCKYTVDEKKKKKSVELFTTVQSFQPEAWIPTLPLWFPVATFFIRNTF